MDFFSENEWRRFGPISTSSADEFIHVFDKVGISTNVTNDCLLAVGNDGLFCVDSDGVGIGTTANGYKLNVSDSANFGGNIDVAGTITGWIVLWRWS